MQVISESIFNQTQQLAPSERREILSRLLATQSETEVGTIWKSVRFSEKLRVVAQSATQEVFVDDLRKLLQTGALVRLENQSEGTCEVYGVSRTFYVTMSENREFVGLLSSWLPENPPVEINVEK
jgi:hypothetical protein